MIGGILAGAMTLIALQVLGVDRSAQGGINGPAAGGRLVQWIGGGLAQLIDPNKAAIPNLAGGKQQQPQQPATPPPSSSRNPDGTTDAGLLLPRNPTLST